MMRKLLPFAALGLALPATSSIYALWHQRALDDESLLVWMLPVVLLVGLSVVAVRRAAIGPAQLRTAYWAVLSGQAVGTGLGLYSAAMARDAAPLWAVAAVSLAMLFAWCFVAATRTARPARA